MNFLQNEHCWVAAGWRKIEGRTAPREFDSTGAPWDWYGQVRPEPRIAGRRSEEQDSRQKEGLARGRGTRGRGERVCGERGKKEWNGAVTQRCLVEIFQPGGWLVFHPSFSPWLTLQEISRGCVQGLGAKETLRDQTTCLKSELWV